MRHLEKERTLLDAKLDSKVVPTMNEATETMARDSKQKAEIRSEQQKQQKHQDQNNKNFQVIQEKFAAYDKQLEGY